MLLSQFDLSVLNFENTILTVEFKNWIARNCYERISLVILNKKFSMIAKEFEHSNIYKYGYSNFFSDKLIVQTEHICKPEADEVISNHLNLECILYYRRATLVLYLSIQIYLVLGKSYQDIASFTNSLISWTKTKFQTINKKSIMIIKILIFLEKSFVYLKIDIESGLRYLKLFKLKFIQIEITKGRNFVVDRAGKLHSFKSLFNEKEKKILAPIVDFKSYLLNFGCIIGKSLPKIFSRSYSNFSFLSFTSYNIIFTKISNLILQRYIFL